MNLIIGCGYLGMRVARSWLAEEHPVAAVTRNTARADEFRQIGLLPIVADVLNPTSLQQLKDLVGPTDTVLYAVGYDRSTGQSMRDIYVQGLRNVLDALSETFSKFIYISSTGVYAQNDGSITDEDSPTEPTREGGIVCLEAERALLAHRYANRAVILRMAGIYGPERIPNRQDLVSQKPLAVNPLGFLNLIHVDDATRIVQLAERAKIALPRTYLVADGNPVLRGDYYREVARLWNTPDPVFAERSIESHERRGNTDKRINTARLTAELQPAFLYPDYRSGLAAIRA